MATPKTATKKTPTPLKATQAEIRRSVEVGPGMGQVSPVMYWYKYGGQFLNEDQALGAFTLAYQQGMDGMGASVNKWMGLTEEQFNGWMRGVLPKAPNATNGPKPYEKTKGLIEKFSTNERRKLLKWLKDEVVMDESREAIAKMKASKLK